MSLRRDTLAAVDAFVARGVPRKKLVVGAPLYARHLHSPGETRTFAEIVNSETTDEGRMAATL